MKGIARVTDKGWVVEYMTWDDDRTYYLPIFPIDRQVLSAGQEVEFEIMTEFTHPELYHGIGWGDGNTYAKIKHN